MIVTGIAPVLIVCEKFTLPVPECRIAHVDERITTVVSIITAQPPVRSAHCSSIPWSDTCVGGPAEKVLCISSPLNSLHPVASAHE